MSDHDVGEIVDRLNGISNLVKMLLASTFLAGAWTATIQVRTTLHSEDITALKANDSESRMTLREMATDIRHMRTEIEKLSRTK